MSLALERWIRKVVNGPSGRWIMVGLFAFLLVIFVVDEQVVAFLRGLFVREQQVTESDVAGSFAVLPGSRTEVTFAEFETARRRYLLAQQFLQRSAIDRASDLDVWSHLVLVEAAKREGITVSAEEVRDRIRANVPEYLWDDPKRYKEWIQDAFRVSPMTFETAIQEQLAATRVLELYVECFTVAPSATRKAAIEQAAGKSVEYALGDYAALDASRFVADAAAALKADADAEAKLRDFYEKDPTVRGESEKFRHPRRYRLEILYSIHANLTTNDAIERIEALVKKAYPEAVFKEVSVVDRKAFLSMYKERLLATVGKTWDSVTKDIQAAEKKEPAPPEEGEKPAEGEPPAPPSEPEPDQEKVLNHAYQLAADQIDREVRLRSVYDFLHAQTRDNVSMKEIHDRLAKHDDAEHPVCATEPGKGLIVYLDGSTPRTVNDLENLEDSGVKFGFSFVPKVTKVAKKGDLPKRADKPDTLGDMGDGRQIVRMLEEIPDQRKSYEELTEGEREDLRNGFYIPARARERAKEALNALRQAFVDGAKKPEQFRAEAEAIGCRVRAGEWIDATYDPIDEPVKSRLWPDEYVHMRDRHFLRRSLAQVLGPDRVKQEYKAGSFLPVDVDLRRDAADPGGAYLFYLRERKAPDATTLAPSDIGTWLKATRNQRLQEFAQRWGERPEQLIGAFRMTFHKDMQARIDDELKRIAEARRRP